MTHRRLMPSIAALAMFAVAALGARFLSADEPAGAALASLKPGQTANLFDGKTLAGWKTSDFAGHGNVDIEDGKILLEIGTELTGITWAGSLPKVDYEITLEAMRVEGHDFFCGLTFPVGDSPCSLIVGGWGGSTVGLSSVDGLDASENETASYRSFKDNQWYTIRVRVTGKQIQAWIDKEQVVDLDYRDRKISIRFEVEPSEPLGIATWCTGAALRNIRLKKL